MNKTSVITDYKEVKPHYVKRVVWLIINLTLFRILIGKLFWPTRRCLLKLFGAEIDGDAYIYHSSTIFAPWLLKVGRACIGPDTELYNKAEIVIGHDTVVSQGAKLYTASHDISSLMMPLVKKPITLKDNVWVAADAFIGPGVTVGPGAVIGARAVVFSDVEPWAVMAGNPAKELKKRVLRDA